MVAFAGFAGGLFAIAFFSQSHRVAVAQPKGLVITPAPQAPTLANSGSLGAKVGDTLELTLTGTNLNDPVSVLLSCPGKVSIPTDNKNGTDAAKLRVKVELPADCPVGLHTLRVATKQGVSNFRPFLVDELAAVPEVDTNRSKDMPQVATIPTVIAGRTDPEMSDFYKVKVSPGQTVTFEVIARRVGSPLDPIIVLHDAKTKRELVDLYADDTPGLQSDCRLTHTFKDGGEFLVEVRDTTYRGGADYFYRLRIGDFPGVTTAFPVAAQRGQTASIGFAGPGTAEIPPVSLKVPADPTLAAMYVSPKKPGGIGGWPVAVRLSNWPEAAEQEPNDEPAKANKLPVPGGVSGRFEKAGDLDHFAITGKKGVKYSAAVSTFEINSPCEVLIRVLDEKGKEIGRSTPAQPNARVEFTPAADGTFVIACEQLNFLSGPNEIYHLTVQPVAADFDIVLAFDRGEAPAGGGTAIAATVNRLNGYTGPVNLSIVGDPSLSGTTTVATGQTVAFVPLLVKDGTKPGAYPFRVQGEATVNGEAIVRVGTLVDTVKATLGGMPNPPRELFSGCALAVVEKQPFEVKLSADPASIEKGKGGKVVVEVVRGMGADGDIAIAPLFVPPNITAAAAKPIAKGATKTDLALTTTSAAIAGSSPFVFRVTTKVGGKDFAIIPPPLMIDITEAKKKDEPKKDEPKK
ncbi:MAG: hypothetical protein C0467_06695 [Planctomycetaceae bacterium]|nr:hypothetical protein [Planctomycetaceae bacterium]